VCSVAGDGDGDGDAWTQNETIRLEFYFCLRYYQHEHLAGEGRQ